MSVVVGDLEAEILADRVIIGQSFSRKDTQNFLREEFEHVTENQEGRMMTPRQC